MPRKKPAIDWTSPALKLSMPEDGMCERYFRSGMHVPVVCAEWIERWFTWPPTARKFWLRFTTEPQSGAHRITIVGPLISLFRDCAQIDGVKEPLTDRMISAMNLILRKTKTTGYLWLEYEE